MIDYLLDALEGYTVGLPFAMALRLADSAKFNFVHNQGRELIAAGALSALIGYASFQSDIPLSEVFREEIGFVPGVYAGLYYGREISRKFLGVPFNHSLRE